MNPVVTRHEADGRLIYAHVLCYGRNVTTIASCKLLDSINHVSPLKNTRRKKQLLSLHPASTFQGLYSVLTCTGPH